MGINENKIASNRKSRRFKQTTVNWTDDNVLWINKCISLTNNNSKKRYDALSKDSFNDTKDFKHFVHDWDISLKESIFTTDEQTDHQTELHNTKNPEMNSDRKHQADLLNKRKQIIFESISDNLNEVHENKGKYTDLNNNALNVRNPTKYEIYQSSEESAAHKSLLGYESMHFNEDQNGKFI